MTILRQLARAILIFGGASVTMLVIAAQLAPGWQAASEQPPLGPEPVRPNSITSRLWPIEQRDVAVRRDDGQPVRAWIVTPVRSADAMRVPGVVLVHGAGTADRDTLLAEAQAFARSGVAAIVYDKRSEGYSFTSRDYAQLADDAIDAANLLAAQSAVDPNRIGILGFSEGGWVAPIAAGRAPDRFAFLILVSATIATPLDEIAWAVDRPLSGAPDWLRRIPATALASGGSFLDYVNTDTRAELEALTVPVYAVWGADDTSIPVVVAVRTLVDQVGTPVTARLLPATGHDPGAGDWLNEATVWVSGLPTTARDEIIGAEPVSRLGLATLPASAWYLNPLGHAALALILAVGSCFLPARGRARHTDSRS